MNIKSLCKLAWSWFQPAPIVPDKTTDLLTSLRKNGLFPQEKPIHVKRFDLSNPSKIDAVPFPHQFPRNEPLR